MKFTDKKCSENSRSQIVFRTDIFQKLTLVAPGSRQSTSVIPLEIEKEKKIQWCLAEVAGLSTQTIVELRYRTRSKYIVQVDFRVTVIKLNGKIVLKKQ